LLVLNQTMLENPNRCVLVVDSTKKKRTKALTDTMEDYLEAIFDLAEQKKAVRVKDIAGKMDVRMPTVTSMLKTLSERGLVNYERYEYVELTKRGIVIGREMRRKHDALRQFLTDILKVDDETADVEACKMEHALGSETLDRIRDFMSFIHTCPRTGESWLERFDEYRRNGMNMEACREQAEAFFYDLRQCFDVDETPLKKDPPAEHGATRVATRTKKDTAALTKNGARRGGRAPGTAVKTP
jgi:DtxR family transcriptional regulator, Mn-dependent transcriptional regulator